MVDADSIQIPEIPTSILRLERKRGISVQSIDNGTSFGVPLNETGKDIPVPAWGCDTALTPEHLPGDRSYDGRIVGFEGTFDPDINEILVQRRVRVHDEVRLALRDKGSASAIERILTRTSFRVSGIALVVAAVVIAVFVDSVNGWFAPFWAGVTAEASNWAGILAYAVTFLAVLAVVGLVAYRLSPRHTEERVGVHVTFIPPHKSGMTSMESIIDVDATREAASEAIPRVAADIARKRNAIVAMGVAAITMLGASLAHAAVHDMEYGRFALFLICSVLMTGWVAFFPQDNSSRYMDEIKLVLRPLPNKG